MDRNFDNKERWAAVLRTYQSQPVSVLEIGSWIGGSAKVFLDLLPLGRITCVDVFDGKFLGHPEQESDFDRNVAPYGDRVEKIKSRSIPALDGLAQAGRSFDIIYVDGSHTRDDALMDTVLAWRMLKPNGTMIWDDYVWQLGKLPAEERPQDAIDVFLEWHADELTVLERGYQVIARRGENRNHVPKAEGFVYPRTAGNLLRFIMREPMRDPRHGRVSR